MQKTPQSSTLLTLTEQGITHLAVCVLAAGGADLLPGELPAAPEGVARRPPRTPADGHVVLHRALRPRAAGQGARVHALHETISVVTKEY